jgi:hypothetical protein
MVDTCCENYDNCTLSYYDKDAEIKRLNEKIEFLARTNMLYSDWEHRETQVTSELIRKGIEEHKINAELRAEIERLKSALAQPAQEPKVRTGDCLLCGVCASEGHKIQAQRPWVGLTPDEIGHQAKKSNHEVAFALGAFWADAKLKEKNNGT